MGSFGRAGSGGEGDDGEAATGGQGPDAAGGFAFIHFWRLAVHEDGGVVVWLEEGDGFTSISSDVNGDAHAGEMVGGDLLVDEVVFDDEDAGVG